MYDTVIIGSGAAGLSAAVYAMRAELSCVVVEKNYMGVGQIAESSQVDNYLGLYGENGFELGEKFRSHAEKLGAEILNGTVTKISKCGKNYNVTLENGNILETKTIIYAAGASHRRLGVKGEAELTGRGVSYCAVCDGAFFKGKTVAVVGGGDTALHDALLLSKMADTVYLIHRRSELRANKSLQSRVKAAENIKLVLNAVVTEIIGEQRVSAVRVVHSGNEEMLGGDTLGGDRLGKATLGEDTLGKETLGEDTQGKETLGEDTQGKETLGEEILNVDGIFVAIGIVPNSQLLSGIASLDSGGYIVAGEDGVTTASGIFAAGDVRTKPLRQIATAVADGANCVFAVSQFCEER